VRLPLGLPLRHGDRVILRDPGSRSLWGAEVVDAAPPALVRRGAARLRAAELSERGSGLTAEVLARGVVRRSLLRRLGVDDALRTDDVTAYGDWLVSSARLRQWRDDLVSAVAATRDGLTSDEAARLLDVPDPQLMALVVCDPVRDRGGRLVVDRPSTDEEERALDALRADLHDAPFAAPDAVRLAQLGLHRRDLSRLSRDGVVLLLGDGVVLLPGADDEAVTRLADLPQPFTTSQARQALETSRRVVLPLLAHLDRTGRTLRLPDDRRRTR
jgi:selenocysteine-specific elongation factor